MNDLIIYNICQYLEVPHLLTIMATNSLFYVNVQRMPKYQMMKQILYEKNIKKIFSIVKKHYTPDNWQEWQALSCLINEPSSIRSYFIGRFKPDFQDFLYICKAHKPYITTYYFKHNLSAVKEYYTYTTVHLYLFELIPMSFAKMLTPDDINFFMICDMRNAGKLKLNTLRYQRNLQKYIEIKN